jgi:hypothetical protein
MKENIDRFTVAFCRICNEPLFVPYAVIEQLATIGHSMTFDCQCGGKCQLFVDLDGIEHSDQDTLETDDPLRRFSFN